MRRYLNVLCARASLILPRKTAAHDYERDRSTGISERNLEQELTTMSSTHFEYDSNRRRFEPIRPISRPSSRGRRGFTLIEAIVVVVMIGILAAVIAPRIMGNVGRAKIAKAQSDLAALKVALQQCSIDYRPPQPGDTLRSLLWIKPPGAPNSWQPGIHKESDLIDPWGHPYVLIVPGKVNINDYDVMSYGADGKEGGDGDNADIVQ